MSQKPEPTSSPVPELTMDRYPRSSAYDRSWVLDNLMGPNPLWLAESLIEVMDLSPGMLDLPVGVIHG